MKTNQFKLTENIINALRVIDIFCSKGFVFLVGENNHITLTTSRDENRVMTVIEDVENNAMDFRCCVKLEDLLLIAKTFTDGLVSVEETNLKVTHGRRHLLRATNNDTPENEFPAIETQEGITISITTLKLAEKLVYATGGRGDRLETSYLHFSSGENDTVAVFACDGYRMAYTSGPSLASDSLQDMQLSIPPKIVSSLIKICAEDVPVILYPARSVLMIEVGNYMISCPKLVENKLQTVCSNLMAQIPQDVFWISRNDLHSFLTASSVVVDKGDSLRNPMQVQFTEKEMILLYKSALGTIEDSIAISDRVNMAEICMGFNIRFLSQTLAAMETEKIQIALGGELSPIYFMEQLGDYSYTHVVLPVRLHTKPEPVSVSVATNTKEDKYANAF